MAGNPTRKERLIRRRVVAVPTDPVGHTQSHGPIMIWVVVFIAASALVGGVATSTSEQPPVARLQYRPGTPDDVVERCRQAVIPLAREHAAELGAELLRVDAASAGEMRQAGRLLTAPVEVGVVYSRPSGQEVRQGAVECRLGGSRGVDLASLPGATR